MDNDNVKDEMSKIDNTSGEDDFFLEMNDDMEETYVEENPKTSSGDVHFTKHTPQIEEGFQDSEGYSASSSEAINASSDEDQKYTSSRGNASSRGLEEDARVEVQELDESPANEELTESPRVDDQVLLELEKVTAERDKFREQLIRKAADLDNYRKRVVREREEQKRFGNEKFAQELLPVLDNMERALSVITGDESSGPLRDGVEMVYRQLISALQRFGVESFESKGTPFDPQKHEAIQQIETEDTESGVVLDEFQKGYFIHDRLLRPAMVSVAKNTND